MQGDIATAAWEVGAGGSRLTHMAGRATLLAVHALKDALIALAAQQMGHTADTVQLRAGRFVAQDGQHLDLQTFAAQAQARGQLPLSRLGNYVPDPVDVTSFCAQIAEVDPDTGQVRLRKLTAAHDVGTVLNPLTHQGQIKGGVAQGLGQALTGHLLIQDGAVSNLHLGDYKLPTTMDMPELNTALVESRSGSVCRQGGWRA